MVASARAASPRDELHALFADHFEWRKRESPEYAMHKGDYTYADRITDNSLAAHERRCAAEREFLERVRKIATAGLSEADLLNREIFERQLRESIDGERFHPHLAPIGGRFGPQQDVPQMHERVGFVNQQFRGVADEALGGQ